MRRWLATMGAVLVTACGPNVPRPVALDLTHDACSSCRMIISSRATASQVVAPGDEPRLFDDLGCLKNGLKETAPPRDAVIYVADHLTGDWLRVEEAVFTQVPTLHTPMSSGIVAHRDAATRDRDPAARDGRFVPIAEVLGRNWP